MLHPSSHQVQRPQKYGFDERALLTSVVTFTLQLANTASFLAALAAEPDYDVNVLRSAHAFMSTHNLGPQGCMVHLEAMLAKLEALAPSSSREDRGGGGANATTTAMAAAAETEGVTEEEAARYMAEMPALCYTDVEEISRYNRHFIEMAQSPQGNTKRKMRRLAQEVLVPYTLPSYYRERGSVETLSQK
jgi:hypothetical protein